MLAKVDAMKQGQQKTNIYLHITNTNRLVVIMA
jgi:hypothetical protein